MFGLFGKKNGYKVLQKNPDGTSRLLGAEPSYSKRECEFWAKDLNSPPLNPESDCARKRKGVTYEVVEVDDTHESGFTGYTDW